MNLSNTNIQALNYEDLNQNITVSSNYIPIQSKTFVNTSNLKEITLPGRCSQFGLNYSYYSGAFACCTSLTKLNFKNFDVADVDGDGDNAVTGAGFDQITQAT